ncbi:DUF5640 domain-containing protein [Sphingobacterium pedocola]|uniref:Lipocalin-like domain-containing protein n=1 Tax=Sphingobacterium pedocola TaxID=2082722 RepID=A0ABR9T269_9SPHI|nr:DUF5640 domain-containing protein [Sphingobacterium pedocola]MBE8719423.1 hypothetical protein [Sphingobacterium pedocola]
MCKKSTFYDQHITLEEYLTESKIWERENFTYKINGNKLEITSTNPESDRDDADFTFSFNGGNLILHQKEVSGSNTYESTTTFKRR